MKTSLFIRPTFFLVFCFFLLSTVSAFSQENFRILPYLQVYETGKVQLTWFSDSPQASRIVIKNSSGLELVNKEVIGVEVPEIYYTTQEKNQNIAGLVKGSWLKGDKSYKYQVQADLPVGISANYTVTLGGNNFTSSFKTPVSKSNWEKIRFIAFSDSETEPKGRVTNRAWYPGTPFFRPSTAQLWKDKFGTTIEQGFELPNYMLSEKIGYAENLKIINSRNPDFMLMPGDLVQGGAYQPGWDEFFRHNAGEFDKGLSRYPIIPALGNWEAFGGLNGGYGTDEQGKFLPLVGRSRFHAYFQTPTNDPLQKHRQSYYRVDYGPVTILTLDSSNGTPDQQRSDFDGTTKLTGTQFTVPGTDTQENFTESQYQGYGGTDLSGFGPGTDQYIWLEENLKSASASGQLIFVQYHHIAFSSGEHGVPMNHELATGQGGTPMRILHPLLEEYGVLAVFSGHDELFELSFVDQDGDGKGVHYYDVGVAGDGLRGVKRNWLVDPLQTLNYNSFSKWTADQNSTEIWDNSGSNPVLTGGGKHYGHLEVNVVKVLQDGKPFARIDFSPVYAFPVLDQNYNLQRIDRRVYPDERSLMVALNQTGFIPVVKDSVSIFLNEQGKAVLTPEDFLEVLPDDPFTYTSSKGFDFTCLNLGVNDVVITSKNTLTAQEWTESTKVWVLDTIPPDFEATDAYLAFDKTIGKVIIDPTSFYIRQQDIVENCLIPFGVGINISIGEITCADLDPDGSYFDKPVTITMTDRAGNSTSKIRKIYLNVFESKKVSISSSETFVGQPVTLTLGDELVYSVTAWHRSFQGQTQVFPDQKGKTFVATLPGTYFASLYLGSACGVVSEPITLEVQEADYIPVVKDSVSIFLNEQGKAVLTPKDFLEVLPDDPFTYTSSKGFDFTCLNIGVNDVVITSKNTLTAQEWTESTKVWVLDTIAPYFDAANATYLFDPVVGKVSISLADFDIVDFKDNCAQNWNITQSRFEVTCADIYQNPEAPVWEFPVVLTSTDPSGNSYSRTVKVIIGNVIESKKVSITSLDPLTDDGTSTLRLGNELGFSVVSWEPNFKIVSQSGNEATISQTGWYKAKLLLSNGCIVYSEDFAFGELAADYKQDIVLYLDESGNAELSAEDVLISGLPEILSKMTLSQTKFTCEDLGSNEIKVTQKYRFEGSEIRNNTTFDDWIKVIVKDNQAPKLTTKKPSLVFDKLKGVLELKPEDFVASLTDNCGIKSLVLNKTKITCADYELPIDLILSATDLSGNQRSELITVTVSAVESQKISISPSGEQQGFVGTPITLTLGAEFGYVVEEWLRDGVKIVGQKEKQLTVSQSGTYKARILPTGGCLVESQSVKVTFREIPYSGVKALVELPLDASGKATLKPEQVFLTWPLADPNLDIKFSQSEFTCTDLGEKQVTVTIKNQTGQTWEEKTVVKVQDKLAPILVTKKPSLVFDKVKGVLELKPEDFVASLTDNCGIKSLVLNKTKITCADYELPIDLILTATDLSGNQRSELITVTVSAVESQKISISPSGEQQGFVGTPITLTLGAEFGYVVEEWLRDGVKIVGQKEKQLTVSQSGTYKARILPTGGCLVESQSVKVTFREKPYSGVKALVELPLDANGKATLKPEQVFLTWPLADPNLDIKFSQSEFTCTDLGEKQVTVTIKNQTGQTWEEKTVVKVEDKLAPILVPKNLLLNFDVTKASVALKPEDFITSLTDNCGIKEVTINKTTVTCEDLGKEIPVAIRTVDLAGNVTEASAVLSVVRVENQKVAITGPAQLCQGAKGTLTLNSAASFEVIRWRRNGVEIPGQTGKTLEVAESGIYHAVIRYTGACLSESSEFEVKVNPIPSGEIVADGNILRAPQGDFTYQWFRNGEKINGATARTLTVDLMGEYQVELTSAAGCVAKLKSVTLTISGLGGNWVNKPIDLKLYPNPASEWVTLELPDGVLAADPEILLYSSEGKNVSNAVQITQLNDQKVEIRLSGLANGTYLVWVVGQNQQTYFGKLVKLD